MSCNTKTSLAAVIDAVNAQLNNNYVDRDDPRINQGVFTEPTIRGGLMLDEAAKLDFCGYVTECGQQEPFGKQWVDRPLYPENMLVSYDDGGEIKSRWQETDAVIAGSDTGLSYSAFEETRRLGMEGFILIDSFEAGATITQRNQALRQAADGKLYRWAGDLPKVVPADSTPADSGGLGTNAWLEVSDATLRQELLSPIGFSKANAIGYFTGVEQLSNFESLPIGSVVTETKSGITFVKTGGVNTINGFKPTGDTVLLSWFGVAEGELFATPKVDAALEFAYQNGYKWVKSDVSTFRVTVATPTKFAIKMRNNVSLDLTDTTITMEASSSTLYYIIACRKDITGEVTIRNGTLIGDRYVHLGTTGEWGMGIGVTGANKVTIENTVIKDCWGDGIVVSSDKDGGGRVRAGLAILDRVVCDNNRRQGVSISDVEEVRITTGSKFINTNGTLPQSGIDVEPDAGGYVGTVIVGDIVCSGNAGYGFLAIKPSDAIIKNLKIGTIVADNNAKFGVQIACSYLDVGEFKTTGNNGAVWLDVQESGVVKSILSKDNLYTGTVGGVITLLSKSLEVGKIGSSGDVATSPSRSIISFIAPSLDNNIKVNSISISDATYTNTAAISTGLSYESIIIDSINVKNINHGILRMVINRPIANDNRLVSIGSIFAKDVNTSGEALGELVLIEPYGSRINTIKVSGVTGAVNYAMRAFNDFTIVDTLIASSTDYSTALAYMALTSEVIKTVDMTPPPEPEPEPESP